MRIINIEFFDTVSSAALPRATPTEIICGDCSGDELLPIRTKLTTTGACAVCGGHSFVLASTLCEVLAQHLKNKKNQRKEITKNEKFTYNQATGNIDAFIN